MGYLQRGRKDLGSLFVYPGLRQSTTMSDSTTNQPTRYIKYKTTGTSTKRLRNHRKEYQSQMRQRLWKRVQNTFGKAPHLLVYFEDSYMVVKCSNDWDTEKLTNTLTEAFTEVSPIEAVSKALSESLLGYDRLRQQLAITERMQTEKLQSRRCWWGNPRCNTGAEEALLSEEAIDLGEAVA